MKAYHERREKEIEEATPHQSKKSHNGEEKYQLKASKLAPSGEKATSVIEKMKEK